MNNNFAEILNKKDTLADTIKDYELAVEKKKQIEDEFLQYKKRMSEMEGDRDECKDRYEELFSKYQHCKDTLGIELTKYYERNHTISRLINEFEEKNKELELLDAEIQKYSEISGKDERYLEKIKQANNLKQSYEAKCEEAASSKNEFDTLSQNRTAKKKKLLFAGVGGIVIAAFVSNFSVAVGILFGAAVLIVLTIQFINTLGFKDKALSSARERWQQLSNEKDALEIEWKKFTSEYEIPLNTSDISIKILERKSLLEKKSECENQIILINRSIQNLTEEIESLKKHLGEFAEKDESEKEIVLTEYSEFKELKVTLEQFKKLLREGNRDEEFLEKTTEIENTIQTLREEIGEELLTKYSIHQLTEKIKHKNTLENEIKITESKIESLESEEILDKKEKEIVSTLRKLDNEERDILEENPTLGLSLDKVDELTEKNVSYKNELDRTIKELQQAESSLKNIELEHREVIGRLSMLPETDVVKLEEETAEIQNEVNVLNRKAKALKVTYDTLIESIKEYQSHHLSHIEAAAKNYFMEITNNKYSDLRLNDMYTPLLKNDDIDTITVDKLSVGAKEQLYLAMRFAFSDKIVQSHTNAKSSPINFPFIFDDPFVNFDEIRLSKVKMLLDVMKAYRQILIFVHNRAYADWGHFIELGST